jgi:hypothetical protein
MNSVFIEKQRLNQPFLWIIMLVICLIGFAGIYKQVILGEPFGNNPMPDWGLFVFTGLMLGLTVALGLIRLHTNIDAQHISMNLFPLSKKRFAWEEVESAEVLDYGFVGGWGIRMGTKYGTAYNVSGSKGLAIKLKNGQKFLIGTQRPEDLTAFVASIAENKTA